MPVFDIFSKRRKRASGNMPDVYTYDGIPEALKVQIIHIWNDALGSPRDDSSGNVIQAYHQIAEILRREYGVFSLSKQMRDPHDPRYAYNELIEFFLKSELDESLDVIELTFKVIDTFTRRWDYRYKQEHDYDEVANNAIDELNARFKEHAIGYFYSDGTIGRVDSELAHAEIVRPALVVLRQKEFASAQSEFLSAHAHYREGKNSTALIECYKAFESTMKIICSKHNWKFDGSKGAADLVRVCLEKGLVPHYWQSHFSGLRSVLESAIPTPRNKEAGHGAGRSQGPPCRRN
jgi:uncharacterized protein DUF7014/AbiJ-like protein